MPGDTMDFGALAARLAVNIDDVRACLLMSRDGLTLGVYPAEHESSAREVWDRLLSIGHPERGFLLVGDELWIVARRGPYAGIVIASTTATPGLLLDRLEFTLRAAEELRTQEGAAPVGPRTEATRRPRTPLHREPAPDPVARGEELPAWLVAAVPEADVAEAVEAEESSAPPPMLDLSSADTLTDPEAASDAEPVPAAEAPASDDEPPLDPVRAAMEFASMTGAVGAIPTLPRPVDPPAPPSDVEPAEEEASAGPDTEVDDPAPDPLEMADIEPLEAPLEPLASLDLPLEELPAVPEEQDEEPDEEREPELADDIDREADAPDLPGNDDEAEVDPVALAREFAQLFNDKDEEAR